MNTFLLVYGFSDTMSSNLHKAVLDEAENFFATRCFQCERGGTIDDMLRVTGIMPRPNDPEVVNKLFRYSNIGLMLRRIKVVFPDSLMAKPSGEYESTSSDYRDGRFTCRRSDGERIDVWCDSRNRTVDIETSIGCIKELEIARLGMLEIATKVLKVSKATKAAVQLVQAQRTPDNAGFVTRSTKELFRAIGDVF